MSTTPEKTDFWDPPEIVTPITIASPQIDYTERQRRMRDEAYNTPGSFHMIGIRHHASHDDLEIVENIFIKTADDLNVNDLAFQDMFMRYYWDEDDGSPSDDETYDYGEGHYVYNRFDTIINLSSITMRQLDEAGVGIPTLYNQRHLENWLDRRDDYNLYHGYDD